MPASANPSMFNATAEADYDIVIVGSGPAGITAAYYLRLRGYAVTIFEAQPVAGGMLRLGIPEYRLDRDVLSHPGMILDLSDESCNLGLILNIRMTGASISDKVILNGNSLVCLKVSGHLFRHLTKVDKVPLVQHGWTRSDIP